MSEPVKDVSFLFKALTQRLRQASPEVNQRITAHVRAVTGHHTLPAFMANGATDEEKNEVISTCLKALLKQDWSLLKGEVPAGQAIPVQPQAPDHTAAAEQPEPAQATEVEAPRATVSPSVTVTDPRLASIVAALQAALQPAGPTVDEATLRPIVTAILGDRLKEIRSEALTKVNEYLAKVPPRDVVEIRKWDGSVKEIGGARHKQFATLVRMLSARNASGHTEFVYAWGAPGAGKTYLLMQLAEALGVKAYPFPCGPTATEGKMLGFNNIAMGSFVAGWLYEPYKNGGLAGLDEIALADGSVMAANNSIENDSFTFGNGEVVKRHKDFYLVAFDNTLGTGSTGGYTRNRLDAATLNRFSHLKLEYDEELERNIFGNAKWAQYVQEVRRYVEANCKNSFYVTPRATRKGAAYLANGIPPAEVADMVLFGLCSKDVKDTILQNVGHYQP